MAKCNNCGKTTVFGLNKPKSQKRTQHIIKPNLQKVNNKLICASCLRTEKKLIKVKAL